MEFPRGQPRVIDDAIFVATWLVWFDTFAPELDPETDAMPIRSQNCGLEKKLVQGHQFSLDVMTRMLVSNRNVKQCEKSFRELNKHILECEGITTASPNGNRKIKGARLTAHGRALLSEIRSHEQLLRDAEALITADIEDSNTAQPVDGIGLVPELPERSTDPSRTSELAHASVSPSLNDIAVHLVDAIEADEFQAHYRGRVVGQPVKGWRSRHASYFWPNPQCGAKIVSARLRLLELRASELMSTVAAGHDWTAAQQEDAIKFANDVFSWGGVPQNPIHVSAANIRAVFENTFNNSSRMDARMNSGWTKVSAIASTAIDAGKELAIWDSRVSHSIISRLDNWFVASGLKVVPERAIRLGQIPGRGGTRKAKSKYRLSWPMGYGSWDAHFAGGQLIRQIRDELNLRGWFLEGNLPWKTRDVEMVLFMDGY